MGVLIGRREMEIDLRPDKAYVPELGVMANANRSSSSSSSSESHKRLV